MRVLKLIQDATIRERGENMLNYWWVTRPKRKLNSVPEVLAAFADMSLNQEWEGQRDSHLAYEDALETAGLKRKGERRDQTGGGARTYKAWLVSLGLIFTQESTNKIKLTLAGEAIMNGNSPVEVLTNQILKYQFPSSFSIGRGVSFNSVMMVGSGKLGFSMSPPGAEHPEESKMFLPFNDDEKVRKISDLDIAIISSEIFHEYWKMFRNSYRTRFQSTYVHLYNELYRGYINERNIMAVDGCRKQWNETAAISKKKLRSDLYFRHEISYRIYRNWEDFEDYNIQNIRKIKREDF